MKHIAAVGGYFIMLYDVFRKRTRWSIMKDLILREIDDLIFGSIGIVTFISFFVGGVVAVQTALNIDNPFIPKYLIGFATRQSIVLEFAPTFTAIILAGKIGSFITSSIGTMRVTEQIDALDIMGVNSANYLILPKIVGLMICMPMLVTLSVFCGLAGGCIVALFTDMITISDFLYGIQYAFVPYYFTYSIIKSFFFGFIIASISAFYGYYAYGGALDVGKASTNAVVNSSVFVLGINVLLTKLLLA